MLGQMREERKFHLEDHQVEDIFKAINAFLGCLEIVHPQWFKAEHAEDIRNNIKQVCIFRKHIVGPYMKMYLFTSLISQYA